MCGDSFLEIGEECDDGNSVSGDGCSNICYVETGYQCTGVGAGSCLPVCGDGNINGTETCDDGNTNNGDGCSSVCLIETGWKCTG